MLRLPGLIDIHVHLRDPGQTEKEDFFTGTLAALAGGFTTILDMPNNKIPIFSLKVLKSKIEEAQKKTVCNIGFYAGTVGNNLDELKLMEPFVFGLKLYFNQTTGNLIIDKKNLEKIFLSWKSDKPILVHSEEDTLPEVLKIVKKTGKKLHVCHVSSKNQLNLIISGRLSKPILHESVEDRYQQSYLARLPMQYEKKGLSMEQRPVGQGESVGWILRRPSSPAK